MLSLTKQYFMLALSLLTCVPACQPMDSKTGTLILFNGTGSAGKSSTARELVKALGNSAEFMSEELLNYKVLSSVFIKFGLKPCENFEKTIEFLNSLPKEDDLNQKMKAYTEEHASELRENEMCRLIGQYIKEGKSVIIDNPMWEKETLEKWQQATVGLPVLHVMVYCSLDKLLEHISARNKSDDKCEERSIIEPFHMYSKIYQPVVKSSKRYIDTLERSTVLDIMNKAMEKAQQSSHDDDHALNKDFIDDFLKTFGLDTVDTLQIAPFCDYDLMVNTGTTTAQKCAEQIIATLSLKKEN